MDVFDAFTDHKGASYGVYGPTWILARVARESGRRLCHRARSAPGGQRDLSPAGDFDARGGGAAGEPPLGPGDRRVGGTATPRGADGARLSGRPAALPIDAPTPVSP